LRRVSAIGALAGAVVVFAIRWGPPPPFMALNMAGYGLYGRSGMEVRVYLPTPLRQYAEGREYVVVSASTVGEALQRLVERFSGLRRHLYSDSGQLRSFVNVFVNEEDIRHLNGEDTPLKEGDTIYIIPAIAGGEGHA